MRSTAGIIVACMICGTLGLAMQKTPSPSPKPKVRPVVGRLEGFELASGASVNKDAIKLGALRAPADRLAALAPFLARSLSLAPTFRWRSTYRSSKATFVLMDGATRLFETKVTGSSLSYPASAPPLVRGRTYSWHIEVPVSDLETAASDDVRIQIVDDAAAQALQQKLTACIGETTLDRDLARAAVLLDARLWYDAVDAYTRLIAREPARADLYEKRGTIYAQIAVTEPESDADFVQAGKLSGK